MKEMKGNNTESFLQVVQMEPNKKTVVVEIPKPNFGHVVIQPTNKARKMDNKYLMSSLGAFCLVIGIIGIVYFIDFGLETRTVNENRKFEEKVVRANVTFAINVSGGDGGKNLLDFLNTGQGSTRSDHGKLRALTDEETTELGNSMKDAENDHPKIHERDEDADGIPDFEGRFYPGEMRPLTNDETVEFDKKNNPIPNTMGQFMAKPLNRDNAMDLDTVPFPSFEQHKNQFASVMDISNFSTQFLESLKKAKDQDEIMNKLDSLMDKTDQSLVKVNKEESKVKTVLSEQKVNSGEGGKHESVMTDANEKLHRLTLEKQESDALIDFLGHIMEGMTNTDLVMVAVNSEHDPEGSKVDQKPLDPPSAQMANAFFSSDNFPFMPFFSPARFAQVHQESTGPFKRPDKDVVTFSPTTAVPASQSQGTTEKSWFEKLQEGTTSEDGFFTGIFSVFGFDDYFGLEKKEKTKSLDSLEGKEHGKLLAEPGDKALKKRINEQEIQSNVTSQEDEKYKNLLKTLHSI